MFNESDLDPFPLINVEFRRNLMKSSRFILFLLFSIVLILASCSKSNSSETSTKESSNASEETQENNKTEIIRDENLPPDQLNLKLEETAEIISTLSGTHYEATLKAVEFADALDEKKSQLGRYTMATFSVKNLSDAPLPLENIAFDFELTDSPEGGGTHDISEHFGMSEANQEVAPGESADIKLIFESFASDIYYVIVGRGWKSTMNQVMWEFPFKE